MIILLYLKCHISIELILVDMFNHMLMEMNTLPPVGWDIIPHASSAAPPIWPRQTKLGFTKIKMINLE